MRRWTSASAAALADAPKPCLLREHLHRLLYDSVDGYFSRTTTPVGVLDHPIAFPKLADFAHYQAVVRQAYQQLQVSWLTPSELFSPHWGQAVARCILSSHTGPQPLSIVEIGAGSGTQARDILSYVRAQHPDVYADMSYRSVEISPALGQLQQRCVAEEAGHASRFAVEVRDAGHRSGWGDADPRPSTILLMEVLDNCPHDKVVREAEGYPWQQVMVGQHAQQGLTELRQHLSDPLISRCLALGGWHPPPRSVWRRIADRLAQAGHSPDAPPLGAARLRAHQALHLVRSHLLAPGRDLRASDLRLRFSDEGAQIYLPTASMQLLETLADALPNQQLIIADFDALPDVQLPGTNAPLVAATVSEWPREERRCHEIWLSCLEKARMQEAGQTIDFDTYLLPPGKADVLFPTSFPQLERMYTHIARSKGAVGHAEYMATAGFMSKHADLAPLTTCSGFCPALQDFTNTSVMIGKMYV